MKTNSNGNLIKNDGRWRSMWRPTKAKNLEK